MAEYYYVIDGNRNGPVGEEDLRGLAASGGVTGETLVWTEGMAEWQPYAAVLGGELVEAGGSRLAVSSPPVASMVTCNVCHQAYPRDEVIRYGANVVCGNCKPEFVQRLREGAIRTSGLAYATFGKRFGAKFLDGLLMYALQFGLNLGLASFGNVDEPGGLFLIPFLLVNLVLPFAYPIFFLGKWGQTLGKMAVKIKVVTPEGQKIGYGRATGRVLSEIVTGLTFGIGYLMVLWDDEKRALHDRMAGTRVVEVG